MPLSGDYLTAGFNQLFDEAKRYYSLRAQRAVPATDSDFNDVFDSQLHLLRRFAQDIIGDKAVDTAFLIAESTPNVNDFDITGGSGTADTAGRLFLKGWPCALQSTISYSDDTNLIHSQVSTLTDSVLQDDTANWSVNELVGRELVPDIGTPGTTITIVSNTATNIVVASGLLVSTSVGSYYRVNMSTPGGARTDIVYLDVFPDEIDTTDDVTLLHDLGNPPVSTVCSFRLGLKQLIKVRENSSTLPTDFTDALGRQHYYYKLATLSRTASSSLVSGEIADNRTIYSSTVSKTFTDGLQEAANIVSIKVNNKSIGVSAAGLMASHFYPDEKDLACQVTALDGDQLLSAGLVGGNMTPAYIDVHINGVSVSVGDGTKTKSVYFSNDGGTTARDLEDVVAGDTVHFNPTIAGFVTDTTDTCRLFYPRIA